ncbi:hypothetical protein LT493_33190 [Streptomyces tricolor]|nr:hypothetical protein [Streptomyces tricolor]
MAQQAAGEGAGEEARRHRGVFLLVRTLDRLRRGREPEHLGVRGARRLSASLALSGHDMLRGRLRILDMTDIVFFACSASWRSPWTGRAAIWLEIVRPGPSPTGWWPPWRARIAVRRPVHRAVRPGVDAP